MLYAPHHLVVLECYNITIVMNRLLWTALHEHCRFTALISLSLLLSPSLLPFNCCNIAFRQCHFVKHVTSVVNRNKQLSCGMVKVFNVAFKQGGQRYDVIGYIRSMDVISRGYITCPVLFAKCLHSNDNLACLFSGCLYPSFFAVQIVGLHFFRSIHLITIYLL